MIPYCEIVTDSSTLIPFSQLITDNEAVIKGNMAWENYTLNDVTMPVIELVKTHALMILSKSYGLYQVEPTILNELCIDVFMYFPTLLQQLAISRLMDAFGVVKNDTSTETVIRTETLDGQIDQNSNLTLGATNTDTNVLNTTQSTTGTVKNENDTTDIQDSTTNITNVSGVQMTGNRSVNLTHNMPEQSIDGVTGIFPVDTEGTPILTNSYVQGANQSFNTNNPIDSNETSEQTILNSNTGVNDTLTTHDLDITNTGNTIRTSVNSGTDNTDSLTLTNNLNSIDETRTSNVTNKQYAYEIKAFLESTDSINAFGNWENRFTWVVGII